MAKSPRAAYRPNGWPVLRTPRWMLAAAAVLVAGLVIVAIPHRPSSAQRAADLRGMVHDVTYDIESCAGGVTDSLTALQDIESGREHDVKTATTIANTAVANCAPGNNQQMEDLVQYQVPESLASFHLEVAVNDLVTWAFPLAQQVQSDVASRLAATTPAEIEATSAQLARDQQALDAQRARIDQAFTSASTALSANVAPPNLPALGALAGGALMIFFSSFLPPSVTGAKECSTIWSGSPLSREVRSAQKGAGTLSGMNSGLNPGTPFLVAAFGPALLHQAAIAGSAGRPR